MHTSLVTLPHAPNAIFLRAGTNDIHNGKTPALVFANFKEFDATIHARLPKTDIWLYSSCPTIARLSETAVKRHPRTQRSGRGIRPLEIARGLPRCLVRFNRRRRSAAPRIFPDGQAPFTTPPAINSTLNAFGRIGRHPNEKRPIPRQKDVQLRQWSSPFSLTNLSKFGHFCLKLPHYRRFLQKSRFGEIQWLLSRLKVLLNAGSNYGSNANYPPQTQPRHCLDLKQIKQVIDLMKRSELTEFEFEEEGFKIKIKRGSGGQPVITSAPLAAHPHSFQSDSLPAQSGGPATTTAPAIAAGGDEAGFTFVKSPMVGTFYRSPSPENPAFVEVGTKVEDKTVVCIIEAMKIMNEIQAEVKGTITELLVENGQPVEYGQRLFKIKIN